jgi:hypothetical protein
VLGLDPGFAPALAGALAALFEFLDDVFHGRIPGKSALL